MCPGFSQNPRWAPPDGDIILGNDLAYVCSVLIKFVKRRARLFPMAAVKRRDRHGFDGAGVDATRVHADAVGMRARYVEGLHSARGAKQVLGGMRIERVGGQGVGAAD